MVIRFKETVRVRVWGKEMSSFRKGEVHAVPTAIAGVFSRRAALNRSRTRPAGAARGQLVGICQSPIEVGDGLLEHGAVRRCARLLQIRQALGFERASASPVRHDAAPPAGLKRAAGDCSAAAASCCDSTDLLSQPLAIFVSLCHSLSASGQSFGPGSDGPTVTVLATSRALPLVLQAGRPSGRRAPTCGSSRSARPGRRRLHRPPGTPR